LKKPGEKVWWVDTETESQFNRKASTKGDKMMKKLGLLIAVAFAMGMFLSTSTFAQVQGQVETPTHMGMHGIFQANDLIGKKVVGVNGTDIGTVKNFIISEDGMVKYLLISKAGAPEGELLAVPFSAIENFEEDMVTLSIAGEIVEKAPVFSKEAFGPAWEQKINSYYEGTMLAPEHPATKPMPKSESHGTMGPTYATTPAEQAAPGAEQQGEMPKAAEPGMMKAEGIHGVIRGSDLIDKSFLSQDGKEVGKIRNVIFDQSGEAKYAIIATGGFLGLGEKMVAVPFDMLEPAPEQNAFMVNVPEAKLKDAPAFSEKTYNAEWEQKVNTYFGAPEGTTGAPEAQMPEQGAAPAAAANIVQMSNLMDKNVTAQEGEKIGSVHDVILQDGKISYLLVSTGMGAEPVVVPWQSAKVEPEKNMVSLDITKAKLDNAPRFAEGDLAKVDTPEWSQKIHSYYGMESKGATHEGTMMEKGQVSEPAHGASEAY
jgi:sporulation protein YlmC with PRC-barrel domain